MKTITAIERRNKRMFAIFERAKELKKIHLHGELVAVLQEAKQALGDRVQEHHPTLKRINEALRKADI